MTENFLKKKERLSAPDKGLCSIESVTKSTYFGIFQALMSLILPQLRSVYLRHINILNSRRLNLCFGFCTQSTASDVANGYLYRHEETDPHSK
jgi:hypothetical protein